jgi:cAMP-binding proteins - catabolite gene activator and regulatory subunit of cAMP-dependent protein kinases
VNTDLILRNISRHIQLDQDEADFFESILQVKRLKRKEFLLKPGEISRTENYINTGCLRTYTVDGNGVEHILMFATEDWWTGDLHSFLTQSPATYFVEALEDTEVIQYTKENLEKLLIQVPKFERFYRIALQKSLISLHQRISQNLSHSAEERYLNFLKKYPHLQERLSQKQIAAYLGITPIFLSMLRKKIATP